MLVDCESTISHNLAALQALFAEHREKEHNEVKIAEILVKISNSASQTEEKHKKSGVMPASLYFKTTKPQVVSNGTPVSTILANPDLKGWHMENLAKVLKEAFGKINVIFLFSCLNSGKKW